MQKILKFLVLIVAFFSTKEVFAAVTVTLGDTVPNSRVHLKTSRIELDMNVNYIKDTSTNELLYCIEPGVQLYDGAYQPYDIYNAPPDIDSKKMPTVALMAYYGYGYQNRTDIKWYIATQYMIWDYILGDTDEIYFINDNGLKITPYENEINTIEHDIANHYLLPSFLENKDPNNLVDKTVKLNEEVEFIDKNDVLKDFIVTGPLSIFNHKVENNKLTMSFSLDSSYYVYFHKDYGLKNPKVYLKTGSQKVISRGAPPTPQGSLLINVETPKLTINKTGVTDEFLTRKNAIYGIFYEDGNPFVTITTGEDGSATLTSIMPGKYYLQELTAPYGYQVNSEKVYFEITKDDITLNVTDELITKHLVIEKYLEDYDNTYHLEPDAEFKLMRNNKFYKTVTTNALGKIELDLPYGDYKLTQTKGAKGYNFCEEISFKINENSEEERIILKNKQIVGSLNITKLNSLTNELILDSIKFKIKNQDTNSYLKIAGNDTFETIEGHLILTNIPYGNYIIEEIDAPDIYKKLEDKITFSITKDNSESLLTVYNTPKTGVINIIKTDVRNNNPLSNVIFGLYNASKELINEYTTDESGKINLENIPIGKYYLKELLTRENYDLNDVEIEIDVKEDTISTLNITNRLKAVVPLTGSKEFLITIVLSILCLSLGVYICNYHENH